MSRRAKHVPWSLRLALISGTFFTFVAVFAFTSMLISVPLNLLGVDVSDSVAFGFAVVNILIAAVAARTMRKRTRAELGLR